MGLIIYLRFGTTKKRIHLGLITSKLLLATLTLSLQQCLLLGIITKSFRLQKMMEFIFGSSKAISKLISTVTMTLFVKFTQSTNFTNKLNWKKCEQAYAKRKRPNSNLSASTIPSMNKSPRSNHKSQAAKTKKTLVASQTTALNFSTRASKNKKT